MHVQLQTLYINIKIRAALWCWIGRDRSCFPVFQDGKQNVWQILRACEN